MAEGFERLADISRLDEEIRVREEEKAGLPAGRAACAKRSREARARVEAVEAQLDGLRQEQRRHESVAEDHQAVLTRLEGQQHQVKSNEAYTALLQEMSAAREAIEGAETAALEAMEALDTGTEALLSAEVERDVEFEEVEREEAAFDARERELDEQVAALRAQRGEIATGLEPALLTQYERISTVRRPAIAIVNAELCTGCRVGIPPQRYLELRDGAVVTCEQCRRILVHESQLP